MYFQWTGRSEIVKWCWWSHVLNIIRSTVWYYTVVTWHNHDITHSLLAYFRASIQSILWSCQCFRIWKLLREALCTSGVAKSKLSVRSSVRPSVCPSEDNWFLRGGNRGCLTANYTRQFAASIFGDSKVNPHLKKPASHQPLSFFLKFSK